MVEMPGMHTKGPIPLRESAKRHGLYEGTINVPMPGDYEIRVVVQDPVQGEATTNISVGTVGMNGTIPQQPTNGGIPK
jgi:RIO-like serine/threonine protein kinase